MNYHIYCFLFSLLFFTAYSSAQNSGNPFYYAPMPQNLPDLYDGSFSVMVSNAANNTLGQNGQGVCRVYLSFEHKYIGDITMVLTSPSGQSVTLVGPEWLDVTSTQTNTWDVAFTRCDLQAQPDPGKSAVWTNDQEWGLFQHYSGTYYPDNGCLDQLSGPVNGRWRLSVKDHYQFGEGKLKGFGISFCDSTGITGNACRANAGTLNQVYIIHCTGDDPNISLPPTYSSGTQPNSALYDYIYAISRASDDVLLQYNSVAPAYKVNVSALDTGVYTICGISYPEDADSILPSPNGVLTMSQLRNSFNSDTGPYCVNVSSNCVDILLRPSTPDTIRWDTVCYPEPSMFFGISYWHSGTYRRTLTKNGCNYDATLKLTTYYPYILNIRDTICAGVCSSKPGFENACSTGVYTRTIPAVYPDRCDTTVRLTLLVLNPYSEINAPVTLLDCTRSSLSLGILPGTAYNQIIWNDLSTGAILNLQHSYLVSHPGLYTLTTVKKSGTVVCTHSDTVAITQEPYLIPVTASGGFVGCGYQTTQLNASAYGNLLNFNWTGPNEYSSTLRNPIANTAGAYVVEVHNNTPGCSGTDTIIVDDISDDVYVNITATNDTISCAHPTSTLLAHTNVPNPMFVWNSLMAPINTPNLLVSEPGIYQVVVTSSYMLCTSTASVVIAADTLAPVITELEFVQPTPGNSNGEINIEATGAPEPFTYVWKLLWQVVGTWEDLWNIPAGTYMSIVTAANGCQTVNTYTLVNRNTLIGGAPPTPNTWLVHPNPSAGRFSVHAEPTTSKCLGMSVYNQDGRQIWHLQPSGDVNDIEIDLSNQPGGVYFLEIMDETTHLWQKLVVKR